MSKDLKTSSKKRINGAKKGKQFERDVSNAIGHIFPAAERMLEYQASGNVGVDIQGTGIFKIQCKRNAGYAPISRIHEVRTNHENDVPVLVTKGNRMEAMAVMPFEKFIYLLEVCHGIQPLLEKASDSSTKEIFTGERGEIKRKIMPTDKTFLGHKTFINPNLDPEGWSVEALTRAGSQSFTELAGVTKQKDIILHVTRVTEKLKAEGLSPVSIHFGSDYLLDKLAARVTQNYTIGTSNTEEITLNNII